jgi:hypothetical protein
MRARRLRELASASTGEHEGAGRVRLTDGRALGVEAAAVSPVGPVVLFALATDTGAAYREAAWPPATARVLPGTREALVRAEEGWFTGVCVAAAALVLVVVIPLAMAG